MSSYMTVKLKKQGTSVNEAPTLFWTSTTPTRTLTSALNFIYCDGPDVPWDKYGDSDFYEENFDKSLLTEYDSWSIHTITYGGENNTTYKKKMLYVSRYHPMSDELIADVVAFYKKDLDNLIKNKEEAEKSMHKYEELATRALNVEVAGNFLEEASNIKQGLSEYDEEIEESRYYYDRWKKAQEFLSYANEDAKNGKFELVYFHD